MYVHVKYEKIERNNFLNTFKIHFKCAPDNQRRGTKEMYSSESINLKISVGLLVTANGLHDNTIT